jgi:hypothetical protein
MTSGDNDIALEQCLLADSQSRSTMDDWRALKDDCAKRKKILLETAGKDYR